ncbi:MAG: RNA polymerase subunit sigma [Bacteroidaceae bacterium]|nr:RNA polymerase subunit sigma [Bacteroidaceae bacterium]
MNEKYQILVKKGLVGLIVEDWLWHSGCDLRLRKAKTQGCRVIETTDTLYAARIVKWLQAAEKVNIVKQ